MLKRMLEDWDNKRRIREKRRKKETKKMRKVKVIKKEDRPRRMMKDE